MNRLKEYLEDGAPEPPAGEYFVITGDCGSYYVSRETATRVARDLDRLWVPRWLSFTDIVGSRIRVLSRRVDAIFESTAEQRTAERSFHRARKLEEKADRRPWEDD